MNTRVKKLLTRRESAAYEGLLDSCLMHDLDVFPKMRLTDVIDIDRSRICDKEYAQIANSNLDFVLVTKDFVPCLALESDFVAEEDAGGAAQAALKEKLCTEIGLTLIRIDCSELALYQVSELMHILVNDFMAEKNERTNSTLASVEYNGCLLHPDSCELTSCTEFGKLAAWLFHFHGLRENVSSLATKASVRSFIAADNYCVSEIILEAENQELLLSRGRCHVSHHANTLGLRVSKSLAACMASRMVEDTRNFVFLSEEPCSIDLKWSVQPKTIEEPRINYTGSTATFGTEQCFIR